MARKESIIGWCLLHRDRVGNLGMKIKALRLDRGGEYLSDEFTSFLKRYGIRSKLTAAYSPQQNGVSE